MLFIQLKVALSVMFHLRGADMKTYWKKTEKGVGVVFQYLFLLVLTFHINLKIMACHSAAAERLMNHNVQNINHSFLFPLCVPNYRQRA